MIRVIRVTTQFSMYDIDMENMRVRRVVGVDPPTPRQGEDCQWQEVQNIWMQDKSILFQWGWNDDGTARCTRTSDINSVETYNLEEITDGAG